MGWTWEVEKFVWSEDVGFHHVTAYTGNSLFMACWNAFRAHGHDGSKCIKITWRPA